MYVVHEGTPSIVINAAMILKKKMWTQIVLVFSIFSAKRKKWVLPIYPVQYAQKYVVNLCMIRKKAFITIE